MYQEDGQDFDLRASLQEFKIEKTLGQGGFGTVMLATHIISG